MLVTQVYAQTGRMKRRLAFTQFFKLTHVNIRLMLRAVELLYFKMVWLVSGCKILNLRKFS